MNKQRKVLITITYNEMGIIIDTKAEEVAQPVAKDINVPCTDTISRQAAINRIESHIRTGDELYPLTDTDKILNHAFEIAASCVYNLPSEQPENMCVNLDIQKIATHKSDFSDLDELPSVQERKKGYDTGLSRWFHCSECGYGVNDVYLDDEHNYDLEYHYCPNCGCAMTEGAEE